MITFILIILYHVVNGMVIFDGNTDEDIRRNISKKCFFYFFEYPIYIYIYIYIYI